MPFHATRCRCEGSTWSVSLRCVRCCGLRRPQHLLLSLAPPSPPDLPGLDRLVDELAAKGRGLVMVMGKGGVGKTTVAAACAIGLVERGLQVHLSTTDPAAHLAMTLAGDALPGLRVDRIDPKVETERYVERIMATRGRRPGRTGPRLAAGGLALALHRRSGGISRLLPCRYGGAQRVRRARYRAHGPHTAADGCHRRLSPSDAARSGSAS